MSNRLLQRVLCWVYPQLSYLHNPYYDFTKLRSWEGNVKKEDHVKLESVYNISDSTIGRYTYISYNSHISLTRIGRFCSIGPNLMCGYGIHPLRGISTSPMFYSTRKQNGESFSTYDKIEERAPITIGNDVYIGANVIILDGVTIGDGAVIGAGAVVSKDIPPYAIAYGVPIKVARFRFPEDTITALQRIKWWNFDDVALKDVEKFFCDIDGFIEKYDSKK